jgi:hypothetical protein
MFFFFLLIFDQDDCKYEFFVLLSVPLIVCLRYCIGVFCLLTVYRIVRFLQCCEVVFHGPVESRCAVMCGKGVLD